MDLYKDVPKVILNIFNDWYKHPLVATGRLHQYQLAEYQCWVLIAILGRRVKNNLNS